MKNHHLKALITLLFISSFSFSNQSFAQLSSFTPTYSTQADSLVGETMLYLSVTFNDISDLGGIQVSVYDVESGRFIMEVAGTRDELTTNGMLLSDHLQLPFLYIEADKQYRFDINPYTIAGSFLEHSILTTSI